ncbi:hypothetical protein POM88_016573 [Heracleum sosnowskyi]|uniref:GAG-pre-integrase domain-containing protein n=1 Tax=Heracleum sosnowskyi TaxID=360622 RepID=A0AAD8MT34_9APIA|nr:hypothetical protein POM88_016573 [Heracleum sosnowskyi]
MSTHKVGTVKIPMFSKEHYPMWKKKMILLLQVANVKYLGVLKNGPKLPMIVEEEQIENNVVTHAARMYPKDPKDYTADEKEDSSLDACLHLIMVDCLDPIMHNHVLNCVTTKHIWDMIKITNEGTEEVRENKMEIRTSSYEHFKSNPGEGIFDVFERYNKLINDLNLHGKHYTIKEINKKFLLTLPSHLEHRISAIREARDLGKIVSTSTALVAEVPQQLEVKVVQPSSSDMDVTVDEYGLTSTSQSGGDFYSMEELEQLEDESMAMIVKKFGNFIFRRNLNLKFKPRFQRESPKQVRRNSYDSSKKNKIGKAYLAEGKSWDDTDSDEQDGEAGNLALMANEGSTSSFMSEVKFTDSEMIYHLSSTVSCARSENDRIILLNTALEKEVKELRLVHVNQDELTKKIAFLENRVNCYIQLETILKDQITGLETKVNAYYNSCKTGKEIFNKQAISQPIGIGYDYNEAIGELSINTPNRVSVEERGVPHVLKGIEKPFFRESLAEPLNEYSIIIQEEMCTEDLAFELANSNKCMFENYVKVVSATETKSDIHKVDQNNSRTNMPAINMSHKACGVVNCMSCAFNVMYVYFNSKHVSDNKTTPRQYVNNKKHVRSKTTSPPKTRVDSFIPKPTQKCVKASYKWKPSFVKEVEVVKFKNVVLPDKGQFFKHMTKDRALLSNMVEKVGPVVTFGDNIKGITEGYGCLESGNVIIEDVSIVEGLKHNLLSISQFCDRGYVVSFDKEKCQILHKKNGKPALQGVRKGKLFIADLYSGCKDEVNFFYAKASSDESWLWHKKMSHLNFKIMNSLVKRELVRGLSQMEFTQEGLCEACQKGKSNKVSHKGTNTSSITEPHQLLHMDLFGPVNVMSMSKKQYALVIFDDYSKYTWVFSYIPRMRPHRW